LRIDLAAVVRAHPFVVTERPPEIWDADADETTFFRLLGEMIAAGLVRNGGKLGELTLNVSNVTVDPIAADPIPAGDYVAITIRGRGDWGPETTWSPDRADAPILLTPDLTRSARSAGARFGYTRVLVPSVPSFGQGADPGEPSTSSGSITVFFPRFRG
jgi:hypothetical protein